MEMDRTERERRVGVHLPVKFERLGRRVIGMAGNISPHGVYVRTDAFLPPGEIVELGIALPRGRTINVAARAVHALEGLEAYTLGRHAGIGFQFVDEDSPTLRLVAEMIDEIAAELSAPRLDRADPVRLVVASNDSRLLDRMTTVLGREGYAIEAASNCLEAYVLCLEHSPELIVAGEGMAINGHTLAARLAMDKLDVRVLCPEKPFTDEDLCEQVAAALAQRRPGHRCAHKV
jgi:hypothetical protein